MTRTGKSLALGLALSASALIPVVFASGTSVGTLDGDPASDYLIGEQLFLPYDAKIPQARQREAVALLRAVDQAGYKIRVA